MRLSELADWKFQASKAASDQARALALAGIGIVWLFAGPFFTGDVDDQPARSLWFAGAFLALALALDLAQLVSRTVLLEISYQLANRASNQDEEDPVVTETPWVNKVSGFFFYCKALALCLGFGGIVYYFWTAFSA